MNDKTRRTLRTAFQTTVALAALIPVLVPLLGLSVGPYAAAAGAIIAAAAFVTRIVNTPQVEAALPGWLKATAPVAVITAPVVATADTSGDTDVTDTTGL